MKKINSILFIGMLGLALCSTLTSCKDYLDREPNTTVSESDAFKNFTNYQGFVELIINCIPDKEKCNWCPSWNWGDDEVFNPEADDRMTHQVDLGNFRAWNQTGNWLYKGNSDPISTGPKDHSLWGHAWFCIRQANMALEHINDMEGTEEEKNLILGQSYFFRAWWHFEMMEYFGGLPYINKVLDANNVDKLPRLSFQACADSCARDFQRAADLLPIKWDDTQTGIKTKDKNQLRPNKITALCYKGKCLLWAGSPLMQNGAQVGAIASGKTYEYNKDYCKKSAETFGEVLQLVENGETEYALVEFKFDDVYNHTKSSSAKSSYSELFYTQTNNHYLPGSTEAIMRGPSSDWNSSNWNTTKVFGPKVAGIVEHDNVIHQPTANLVEMYGMVNGLPIDDPESGFDPTHPFLNRDPRFYHDIVFDGFKYLNGATSDKEAFRYCELFTGGNMRPVANGSQTGYFIQKLVPHTCNIVDKGYDWGKGTHTYLSYMRLADVYLMYAEACAAVGGATYIGDSTTYNKTAEQAVNVIRDRCGCGHVAAKYVADDHKFMDEIRRERAVELSFEGFRFCDLQRWLLLTEYPYNTKFSQEFDRAEDATFFMSKDPKLARVRNYRKEPILVRRFDKKHYWFPFPEKDTYMYAEFEQNPGW
ncbi:MAG: RagB/SusD family nutrient uptake outer membrane protein [Salinivirgaceae bacterium]|nr:RagB/SusD family nutrient uptake outer membrane protein [Salinivirgaceae bacterium]